MPPSSCRFEARVSGGLTGLEAPKERRKVKIEPMQGRVLALTEHGRESRFERAKFRDLGVLLFRRIRNAVCHPGVASLLQHRVVELACNAQHFDESTFLRARGIQPHFVQPAQLTIETRGLRHPHHHRQQLCHQGGTVTGHQWLFRKLRPATMCCAHAFQWLRSADCRMDPSGRYRSRRGCNHKWV